MYVIGTAGHVDHGKSTLVKALTGIDPDRLQEEKERGMTIDLGFAWLTLPSGREISIVDVPGHERFIKNMLAGVGGIDLALLVVAADESVMPQTEEHLAILDLLRVRGGVVAVTKQDLVEPDWLELVLGDIEAKLKGTVLEGAPLVPVSAYTGYGLPELLRALDARLEATPPKRDLGKPRLPVDRVFTVAGFGTVVTGTLIDGRFQAGQEVEILPSGKRTRIRGIQTHRERHESANPGSRVALNLNNIATEELRRGDVVTNVGALRPTRFLDVHLKALTEAPPLQHNANISFHSGSAEAMGKVALLDANELQPGATGWAQVKLDEPVAVAKGDLFIIRSPNATLGGGEVVDPHAKRHRRFQPSITGTLETLQRGTPAEILLEALRGKAPIELGPAIAASGLSAEDARVAAAELVAAGEAVRLDQHYLDAAGWQRLRETAESILGAYHRAAPLRPGFPKEELKSRLGLTPRVFTLVLRRLVDDGALAEEGSLVRLVDHAVRFTPRQTEQIDHLFDRLLTDPYSPPSRAELEAELRLEPAVTEALLDQGRLVRLAENVILPAEVYREMLARIKAFLTEHGSMTVAQTRDLFGTSRKYALAIMEYLDQERVTRRVGDDRVLR